jgi:AcrR family transcriptional regulator
MRSKPDNSRDAGRDAGRDARWRRRKEERPDEILRAALKCFAERGFAATRLDEIAARAGVTKGTVYLYFRSKEELFKSVVRQEIIVNIDNLAKIAADQSKSGTELLEQVIQFQAKILSSSEVSALPKLIIAEGGNFPEIAQFYFDEVASRAFELFGSILQRGIDRGEFRHVNVEDAVKCVIAPLLFVVIWKHAAQPYTEKRIEIDSLLQTHLELILRGLSKDPNNLNLRSSDDYKRPGENVRQDRGKIEAQS